LLGKGIICVPCLQGGRYVGLGKYHGIKRKRLRQVSDEAQLMGPSHLDALPNYLGKDYKGVFLGNPLDPEDPLGMIAEPVDGWANLAEPTKTAVWDTKMLNGKCVNLVGTDSPNFDYPQDQPPRYKYLVNRTKIDAVASFWGKDSQQYYSQCVGVMKTGLLLKRVIRRDMCAEHHAQEKAVWSGKPRKKIYAVDAAYSGVGGDRCVAGCIEFGEDINGLQIIKVNPPQIIKISIKNGAPQPEDQIAAFVKEDADRLQIPGEDIFYDSTGRGTMGAAFAAVFKDHIPVPVEFGGSPTARPVRHDLFVIETDREGHTVKRRHKRCDEEYVDMVTELWFTARYVIICDQMRELPSDVMAEGCSREHGLSPGNKTYVESKHDPKARERMKRSPDLFDWLVTAIEGARQRGFKIQKLGITLTENANDYRWLTELQNRHANLLRSKQIARR